MQYTILIDQVRCVQWNLSLPEGVVLEVISRAAGWADPIQDDRGTFYRITHGKFRQELPLILKSEQTGRRILESLAEKKIIEKALFGNVAAYRLTEKGRQWNSDHPAKMEGSPYQIGRVDPTKLEGPSIREPLSGNHIQNTPPSPKVEKEDIVEIAFERFYKKYPLHKNPGAARRAFKTAIKKATMQEINDGLDRYIEEMKALHAQAHKNNVSPRNFAQPASWLNGERWKDESEIINIPRKSVTAEQRILKEQHDRETSEKDMAKAKAESEEILRFFHSLPENKKLEIENEINLFLSASGIFKTDGLFSRAYDMAKRSRLVQTVRPLWKESCK